MADFNQGMNQNHNTTEDFERFNSDGTKKKGKGDKKGTGLGMALVLIVVLAVALFGNSMVVTRQNQFKLIRQFGRVQRVVRAFIQDSICGIGGYYPETVTAV